MLCIVCYSFTQFLRSISSVSLVLQFNVLSICLKTTATTTATVCVCAKKVFYVILCVNLSFDQAFDVVLNCLTQKKICSFRVLLAFSCVNLIRVFYFFFLEIYSVHWRSSALATNVWQTFTSNRRVEINKPPVSLSHSLSCSLSFSPVAKVYASSDFNFGTFNWRRNEEKRRKRRRKIKIIFIKLRSTTHKKSKQTKQKNRLVSKKTTYSHKNRHQHT